MRSVEGPMSEQDDEHICTVSERWMRMFCDAPADRKVWQHMHASRTKALPCAMFQIVTPSVSLAPRLTSHGHTARLLRCSGLMAASAIRRATVQYALLIRSATTTLS